MYKMAIILSFILGEPGERCITAQCYLCEYPRLLCSRRNYFYGAMILVVPHLSRQLAHPWDIKHYHRSGGTTTGQQLLPQVSSQ